MKTFIKNKIRDNKRKYYTNKAKKIINSFEEPLKVNHKSFFTKGTTLGKNTNFNGMKIAGGGNVSIGDNFHSGEECLMITQNHNFEGGAIPYDNTYIYKDIMIGDNVWLGSRVIILGGVTIGEGAIIQAGAVVVSDIPKCGIAGGSPAKVFKYRDVGHYEKMKQEGKFH